MLTDSLLIEQFDNFFNDLQKNTRFQIVPSNRWLEGEYMKVYVRMSIRMFKDKYEKCVDIATMEVYDEKDYGKGIMTNFLAHAIPKIKEKECKVFVENVLENRLAEYLKKTFSFQNYSIYSSDVPLPQSLWL